MRVITRDQFGKRIDDPSPERADMRDARAELEGVRNDMEKLIRRLETASEDHGCVYEACHDAAEYLKGVQHDEIDPAIRLLDLKLS